MPACACSVCRSCKQRIDIIPWNPTMLTFIVNAGARHFHKGVLDKYASVRSVCPTIIFRLPSDGWQNVRSPASYPLQIDI